MIKINFVANFSAKEKIHLQNLGANKLMTDIRAEFASVTISEIRNATAKIFVVKKLVFKVEIKKK